MKHKNTQPLYIFNRENPLNSEPQNGPRSGLDYIALTIGFNNWRYCFTLLHLMNMLKRSKDPYLPNLFFISQILGKDHAVAYYSYVDELPSLDGELYKVSYSHVHFSWNEVFFKILKKPFLAQK